MQAPSWCVSLMRAARFDNRRGQPEIMASPALALRAMVEIAGNRRPNVDAAWADGLRRKHRHRMAGSGKAKETVGPDGKIHPLAIFDAISAVAMPDHIAIADGGDLLSFARIGLGSRTYMDAGAFGCLGVGVPFAIAAALACPGR
jgi:acetolactate synthase I/II/III large subunit